MTYVLLRPYFLSKTWLSPITSKFVDNYLLDNSTCGSKQVLLQVQSMYAQCFERPKTQNVTVFGEERFIDQEGNK